MRYLQFNLMTAHNLLGRLSMVFTFCYALLFFVTPSIGQLYLVEDSYKGAVAQGPANHADPVTFFKKTGYNQYAPADVLTQVQFSLTNMQVEPDGVEQVITFGSSDRETLKWPKSELVYQPMKNIARPISKLFTNMSDDSDDILTSSNYGFWMFASIKHYSKSKRPKVNEKDYFGDLVITFNRPVSNPILQIVGLGGTVIVEDIVRGFSAELELQNRDASLRRLSGSMELEVSSDRIYNSASQFAALCGSGAACGSVEVLGKDMTELVFRIFLKRDTREDGYRGKWPLMRNMQKGDGFLIGVSFQHNATIQGKVELQTNADLEQNNMIDQRLLRVNVIDPIQTKVIGSVPVGEDGRFSIDGLTARSDYIIQLNTVKGIPGDAPPAQQLPGSWRVVSYLSEQEGNQTAGTFRYTVKTNTPDNSIDILLTDLAKEEMAQQQADDQLPDPIIPLDGPPKAMPEENNEWPAKESIDDSFDTALEEEEPAKKPTSEPNESIKPEQNVETEITEEGPVANDCVIIVGSFSTELYANQMRLMVREKGLELYVGQSPSGLTRIGYRASCADIDAALYEARQNFDPEAWVLE